jgi:hypothetical protein
MRLVLLLTIKAKEREPGAECAGSKDQIQAPNKRAHVYDHHADCRQAVTTLLGETPAHVTASHAQHKASWPLLSSRQPVCTNTHVHEHPLNDWAPPAMAATVYAEFGMFGRYSMSIIHADGTAQPYPAPGAPSASE